MHCIQIIKKSVAAQRWHAIPFSRFVISLIYLLAMPGCSSLIFNQYGANGLSHKEFVRYVEEVFRLQNKMTSEIMLLPDDEEPATELLLAERDMYTVCAPLNEYVSREMDGLYKGYFLRKRVEHSATECERAAHALEALLKATKPSK